MLSWEIFFASCSPSLVAAAESRQLLRGIGDRDDETTHDVDDLINIWRHFEPNERGGVMSCETTWVCWKRPNAESSEKKKEVQLGS